MKRSCQGTSPAQRRVVGVLRRAALLFAALAAPGASAQVFEVRDDSTFVQISARRTAVPAPVAAGHRVAQPVVAAPAPLAAHFVAAGAQYGLAPALLEAVAWQESRFSTRALSPAGASGVMQLMPATARQLGRNVRDPAENILGGAHYLRQMLEQFPADLPLALAAYNAGPAAVRKYRGVPPFAETQRYVSVIMSRLAAVSLAVPDRVAQP